MTNTNLLKAKIVENGLTQKKMAELLKISLQSFNYKVNNKREFTVNEIVKICDLLKIENKDTYFFAE